MQFVPLDIPARGYARRRVRGAETAREASVAVASAASIDSSARADLARRRRGVVGRCRLNFHHPTTRTRAAMTTYSFPILGNSEILSCLRELDVPLTESDLLRPAHETLRPCYETLVEIFFGRTLEEICAPDEKAMETLDYPELYTEAIPNLAFIRAMQDLARGCGIDDFGLKDIFKPEYGRTRRNLSAFINFAKFREERLIEYEEALANEAEEERRYREELELGEKLKAEIAEAERELAEYDEEALAREIEELEREVEAATLEANRVEAEAVAAQNELRSLESEGEQLRQHMENLELEKASAASEEAHLIEQERQEAEKLAEQVKHLKMMEEDLREAIEIMKSIEQKRAQTEEEKLKLRHVEEEIASKEEEMWKMDAKIEQLQRQKEAMDEKMTRMREQGKLKIEAAEAALRQAKEELAAAEARATNHKAQEEMNKKEAAEIEASMKKMVDEHNRDMNELMRAYEELRDTVVEYHSELFEAMEAMSARGMQREREIANASSPGGSSILSTPPSAMSLDNY